MPKKVRITSDGTTIVSGGGSKSDIEGRVAQIRREIEGTDSDYDREKLQERLAKLAGGVAQINVGAATETEMKERKALIDDARAATQAALGRRHRSRWRNGIASLQESRSQKLESGDRRRSKARRVRIILQIAWTNLFARFQQQCGP